MPGNYTSKIIKKPTQLGTFTLSYPPLPTSASRENCTLNTTYALQELDSSFLFSVHTCLHTIFSIEEVVHSGRL